MKSIRMIADMVGVSQMTVSRVLNNRPGVKPKLRERIIEVAERIGYRPNPLITALMSDLRMRKNTPTEQVIAFVTTFHEELIWKQQSLICSYLAGAKERAGQLGYGVEHFWLDRKGMTEKRFSSILYARSIRGLLMAPVPIGVTELKLDWSKFTAVHFGQSLKNPHLHSVINDQLKTFTLALKNIRRLGYRKIGFIYNQLDDERVERAWRAAYLLDQDMNAKKDERLPIFWLDHKWWGDVRGNLPRLKQWLEKYKPDVYICIYKESGKWMESLGYKVPDDIGYVHPDVSDVMAGKFAGVNQHHKTHGYVAVDMLVNQLYRNEYGIPQYPHDTVLCGEWSDGTSLPLKT